MASHCPVMTAEKRAEARCLQHSSCLLPPTANDPVYGVKQRIRKRPRRSSSKRSSFFGIESKSELVWDYWEKGKNFPKTLVLMNIQNKLQRLHVRPPVSKFFTTPVASEILLSPGTSYSIQIIFTPLQKCDYEDSIEFQSKNGSFQVRLSAPIPCHYLEVPDSVLLPMCAVQHSSQTTFLLRNASKLHTSFRWVCEAPFQLSPMFGRLGPNQGCNITVMFHPQEAESYQKVVECNFGDYGQESGNCCNMILQGKARNTFLQIRAPGNEDKEHEHPVLDFGPVGVGKSLQKHFEIFNPSSVTASFSLSRLSGGLPLLGSVFRCSIESGDVASGESQKVGVIFAPDLADAVSVEYLSLECKGAPNGTQLKLTGTCTGPKVSLSRPAVNFGYVQEGESAMQTFGLENSSSIATVYQWDLDCSGHSVFSIQPASGSVQPQSNIKLTAFYKPMHPNAHYRRVACLILHGEPLFLDLIGTGDPRQKREIAEPDIPNEELDGDSDEVKSGGMEEFYQFCCGCTEAPHVCVAPNELLFNHKFTKSVLTTLTSTQSVTLSNHTKEKVSLQWTIADDSPFSISPTTSDLAPLKATSFRVTYNPKVLNSLHGAQLECFAYNKMDNKETGEVTLCQYWCVIVRVIGHSFQPGNRHFEPHCSLEPTQVIFPGLHALSYRMVLLKNHGHLPLTFVLECSSRPALAESVSVIPKCGLVQPGEYQILTLKANPTDDSPRDGLRLQLQLNAAKYAKELIVVSALEKLNVYLEEDGTLNFPPTAVGSLCRRTHYMRNISSLPLRFKWSISEQERDLISVEPDAGELNANEISVHTWSFRPPAQNAYTFEPTVTFWPVHTDGRKESQVYLKVSGMGSEGFIEAEQEVMDVDEVLVGSSQSVEVPVVNNSPCSLSFCLSVHQELLDEDLVYDPETEPIALRLDSKKATISPHSTMQLRLTVRPHRRANYLCKISYQNLSTSGFVSSSSQELCEVRFTGVVPILQVTDVSGGGCIERLEKAPLWKLLSLDELNYQLLSVPSAAELTQGIPTKRCLRMVHSIDRDILDFNFDAAPMHSAPSTFLLMFHNPSSFLIDWAFLFPADQPKPLLEYWTDSGAFSTTELSDLKDQVKHLFSISPHSGTLLPGQKKAVRFSYSHELIGTNRLPIVFTQCFGIEIMLIFQGLTVERNKPYIHYTSNTHSLTPVSIADSSPPRQVFKLHNAGALSAHYKVDTDVLSQLQVDNFNHAVLSCLNPEGEITPGRSAMLEWVFSPLEAKMYHMHIPIHIIDGETTVVRFEGWGFGASNLDSPNTLNCRKTKARQRVPFPGQVLFMSEEKIAFNDIRTCAQYSTILFLNNVCQTDSVHYMWDVPNLSHQQVVQILPEKGSVSPGESALCVLTFRSTDYPTIYELDIICQVLMGAELNRYFKALRLWEEERGKHRDEFIITDNKEKRAEQKKNAKLKPLPKPPHLTLLHLEVTARSHRPHQGLQSFKLKTSGASFPRTPLPEKDISLYLLNTMIWNILHDIDFTTLEKRGKAKAAVDSTISIQDTAHADRVLPGICKDVLLNTLQNLMVEAVRGELELTAHPRSIMLPPASARRISILTTEQNKTQD